MCLLLCVFGEYASVYTISSCGCLVLIPDVGLQSYVIQHMLCVCAGKILYTNGLFTFVAAVGARRSILTIPGPLSPIVVWLVCVHVCVCACVFYVSMCPIFVSWLLALPQTAADRHNLHAYWIIPYTHAHTHTHKHMHRLEDKWTSLTHRQRCGQAAFPFECSAKPQATITLVPVCLTAAEIECCVFTVLLAAGWWCDIAGVWQCRLYLYAIPLYSLWG